MSAPFLGNETEISGREKTTGCNKKTKSPIQKPTSTDSPSRYWTTCVSTETQPLYVRVPFPVYTGENGQSSLH